MTIRTVVLQKHPDQKNFGIYVGDDYPSGIYVVTIDRNSPAADAKVVPGDHIIAVNGQPIPSVPGNGKETFSRMTQNLDRVTLSLRSSSIVDLLDNPKPQAFSHSTFTYWPMQNQGVDRDLENFIRTFFSDPSIRIVPSTPGNTDDYILMTDRSTLVPPNFQSSQQYLTYTGGISHDEAMRKDANVSSKTRSTPSNEAPNTLPNSSLPFSKDNSAIPSNTSAPQSTATNLPVPQNTLINSSRAPANASHPNDNTSLSMNQPSMGGPSNFNTSMAPANDSTNIPRPNESRPVPATQPGENKPSAIHNMMFNMNPAPTTAIQANERGLLPIPQPMDNDSQPVHRREENRPQPVQNPAVRANINQERPYQSMQPSVPANANGMREVTLQRVPNFTGFGFHLQYNKEYYVITNVEPNSPAERGNLRKGDVIRKIFNQPIENVGYQSLITLINKNQQVVFTVQSMGDYGVQNPNASQRNAVYPPSNNLLTNSERPGPNNRKSFLGRTLSKLRGN